MNQLHSYSSRTARWTLYALALLTFTGSLSCDTVAEISFSVRKFDRVASPGFGKVTACQEDDTNTELRFMLLDQSGDTIVPGALLESTAIDSGSYAPFTADDVNVTEGRLYSTSPKALVRCDENYVGEPDGDGNIPPQFDCVTAGLDLCQPIGPDDDLGIDFTAGSGFCRASCGGDADCPSGKCVTDADGNYCAIKIPSDICEDTGDCASGFGCEEFEGADVKLCTRDTTIQTIRGSLDFISPPADAPRAIAIVMDNSGSLFGKGVSDQDSTVVSDRATDRIKNRIAAAKAFLINLKNKSYKENTVLALWSFTGESQLSVRAETGSIDSDPVKPYVLSVDVVRNALQDLALESNFGRSNVYDALTVVAENMNDIQLVPSRQATIILFTDGPDDSVTTFEGADEADISAARDRARAKYEGALDALETAGAQVIIVHLDHGIGPDGLAALAPDPINAMPVPRDANGRTGPLAEYGDIACRTGGYYLYATDAHGLTEQFNTITALLGGTWKVDVGLETVENIDFNGPYKVSGVLDVSLDNKEKSYFFSPLGNRNSTGIIAEDDSRPVIFKREGRDQ